MKYMLLIYNEEKAKGSEKEREDCKNEAMKRTTRRKSRKT